MPLPEPKRPYGDSTCFHGRVDNIQALRGTLEDAEADVPPADVVRPYHAAREPGTTAA